MGFLFLVLYPRLLLPVLPVLTHTHSHTHSHTHTHSLTHSVSQSVTHSLTHALTHALTHSRTHARTHSLTHSRTHSLTHSHTHSHSLSLTLTHSHSLSLTLTHSHSLSLTLTHSHSHSLSLTLTHSHSLTHTHSHSLTLTLTHTHSHSLTLTHTHSHSLSLTLTHSHSLSLTLTHSHSLSLTLTHARTHSLTHSHHGRRGTMCTVKGLFCVAGVGQCALSRGRMYAPGFRWRPWVSASFAWQAWDNVHCQGVGCTPRGSAGVPGSPPLLRGRRGTMCIAKGSDVRPGVPLASLGLRLFCVAGVGKCALSRGRMYAPGFRWRPWVSASFAWQAWDNVHCQGVGCTPRSSAGVPGSPPLLRGRRGTMCTVKGSDVRPGVPLASLGLRLFCVAGVGQCALSRGRMYAPGFRWRPWVSASLARQAWDNVHCQGVGCTPRGSAGVPGSPPLLRGRRGTMCTVKGSDVRPGVPLASLGLRLFCVAGVGQCARPRGWMYALRFR